MGLVSFRRAEMKHVGSNATDEYKCVHSRFVSARAHGTYEIRHTLNWKWNWRFRGSFASKCNNKKKKKIFVYIFSLAHKKDIREFMKFDNLAALYLHRAPTSCFLFF